VDDLSARLLPKHVASSGAVQQLNVLNYAFAAPDATLKCASLDTFADYGKRFDATESVDGRGGHRLAAPEGQLQPDPQAQEAESRACVC